MRITSVKMIIRVQVQLRTRKRVEWRIRKLPGCQAVGDRIRGRVYSRIPPLIWGQLREGGRL